MHAYSFLILLYYALNSEEISQSHGSEETPAGLEVQGAYDISPTLFFFFNVPKNSCGFVICFPILSGDFGQKHS